MQRIGDQKQFWSGLTFLALGGITLWFLPPRIGTAVDMGPGYFPLLLGVFLIGCGVYSIVMGVRSGACVRIDPFPLMPLLFILAAILVFGALITSAGLAVSLACLVGLSCYERILRNPLQVLAIYLVLLPLTWVVFIYAIQLPIELFW